MPLFAIYAVDRPNALALRLEHDAARRAYVEEQEQAGIKVVLSGPLQSDNGEEMLGSLVVIEAPSRAAADHFVANDPFTLERVWGDIQIHRFHRRKG